MTKYTYHRNGSSGWPFWVKCDSNTLKVVFTNGDTDGLVDGEPRFKVSMISIAEAQENLKRTGTAQVAKLTRRLAAVVFEHADEAHPDDSQVMIAITDQDPNASYGRIAVFDVECLPDVRFLYNSYRGDHFIGIADEVLTTWKADHS